MAAKIKYDVFISYSSRDKAWVRGELLKRIEQAGLKAFIDFRDFTRGAPSIKEMERGVVECRKTLLILSPDYIGSEWCEIEHIMAHALGPANRKLRTIPLLKANCKKPVRIAALTHIDFTDGADHELAWRQLLTALGAPPEPKASKEPKRGRWFLAHPYPMPPNFTGRVAERAMLNRWLDADATHPLLSLRALGGFGKSALVWHWLTHDVNPAKWPRVVWRSFYEGNASFDAFLAETLDYLSKGTMDAANLSGKNAVKALLQILQRPGTLLVLDGFERELRAFGDLDSAYQGDEAKHEDSDRDCISPLAEAFLYNACLQPQLRSKVLLTTRLRPRVTEHKRELLEGCCEEELRQMQPADAVEFFHAQGIRGTHTEIETACAPYGYHPLSLRLLAGLIVGDFAQPGDVAAAKRLDVSGDLIQRQHHVLETAYDSLTPACRDLLGNLACFRSPVSYKTLKALAVPQQNLEADLHDLVARGILHHDIRGGRFDLHPIVRSYAYDRLAAPDRATAHTRLRDYFAAVPPPDKVTCLEDLAPVIELYHHTVRAGQLDEARSLYRDRLAYPLYFQLGAYQVVIDLLSALFLDGEDHRPRLKDEDAQAWTMNELAISYTRSGQPRRSMTLCCQHTVLSEENGNEKNLSVGLINLADNQLAIGALRSAEANLRRVVTLCRETGENHVEAAGHQELGRLLTYRGAYSESEAELNASTTYWTQQNDFDGLCIDDSYRALGALLVKHATKALSAATASLTAWKEAALRFFPVERTLIKTRSLLGAAQRIADHPDQAERHLLEALERCRRINLVELEADILIDLARLRNATGAPDEAQRLADEALLIAERCEYVLQGADAHLELAKLARARGDKATAREHAQKARNLATCDGPPDYTYKAVYEEAGALLKQLA